METLIKFNSVIPSGVKRTCPFFGQSREVESLP